MRYRPYQAMDHAACLDILASNQERYFSLRDPGLYREFLARLPGFYGVVEGPEQHVLACGGFCIEGPTAVLTWGMVHADYHRRGIGRFLLNARMRRIAESPGVEKIVMNTAEPVLGFYERMGFAVVKHTPDGYSTGLDRYDLERPLRT